MPQKIKDLAVKTGSYVTTRDGDTKGRYENVGSILQMDDGSKIILLKRCFNPSAASRLRKDPTKSSSACSTRKNATAAHRDRKPRPPLGPRPARRRGVVIIRTIYLLCYTTTTTDKS
jgi:hypothetical protein